MQIRLAAAAVVELEVVVVGTTPLAPLVVEPVLVLVLELLAVDEAILAVASNTLPINETLNQSIIRLDITIPALLPVVLAVGMD